MADFVGARSVTQLVTRCGAFLAALLTASSTLASEADLVLPDISSVSFVGINGRTWLLGGLVVCALGMAFGLAIYKQLRDAPVHRSMLEVSELIYGTCKTYLFSQGKFILLLQLFIGAVMVWYFKYLLAFPTYKVLTILAFSLVGIAGSYGVAWFGIRVNTFANSRAAFASLKGKPYPVYAIPLQAGISIGALLISVELAIMLGILLFVPRDLAGPCFIGFAIGESLAASALRIAGGIFTKIADIGADLMKIVFKIDEDDARNPGVIADCTGDNAGDSVGPTADGFETYGVTGVALITFILLAVKNADGSANESAQVSLLVWLFMMRVMMIVASIGAYIINQTWARAKYEHADEFDYEHPLTVVVWLTSLISVAVTYGMSYLLIPNLNGDNTLWWKLSTIITCGTLAGAIIPELVKIFTSTKSRHVQEVVGCSREGGASLNILSGLTAGNFSAFWLGLSIVGLMAVSYYVSMQGLGNLMLAPAVFAFGLVAFGFLGMGPVTIAVDSYGPVADNAQSVFELSMITSLKDVDQEIERDFGFRPQMEKAKHALEANDGAGNTFKATAKPVLIGTAVVGATTLIFSIIFLLAEKLAEVGELPLTAGLEQVSGLLSILHPPFMLGLILGGAVIYWFTGASIQAVTAGAYRAVEYIKKNMKLDNTPGAKASTEDTTKVVAICTQYAQRGMFNIFLAMFFLTLSFALMDEYFFIGYLISIAIFGLYQAIFMANAGGAWDNAKKIVEVELKQKGTELHAATVVGDTVGDPFKDTSSVALNPVIKFTTLFGLLAVELAIEMPVGQRLWMGALLLAAGLTFVYRSFYKMRVTD